MKLLLSPASIGLVGLFTWALGPAGAATTGLTVDAGDRNHALAIVRAPLPTGGTEWRSLIDANGQAASLQSEPNGSGVFILRNLKKGEQRRLTLSSEPPPNRDAAAPLQAVSNGNSVEIGGGPSQRIILQYQMKPTSPPDGIPPYFAHSGYLHPVFSPGGKLVTGDYPPDHPWHRGIWHSWTKTEFDGRHPDFWNMAKEKTGRALAGTEFVKLLRTWNGQGHAGFVSQQRSFDGSGGSNVTVLNETWEIKGYNVGSSARPLHLFDLTSTQACATDQPLKLPQYHYGGLGVRGSREWDAIDTVDFLTSTGANRIPGDAKKANWVYLGGRVHGTRAGLAILAHPTNFRSPEPWRLNPSNPQLCVAPSQDGDWEITPGKPYVARYRFVVTDALLTAEEIQELWDDFAWPATVRVNAP